METGISNLKIDQKTDQKISHQAGTYTFKNFELINGGSLDEVSIFFETWGSLNEDCDNAILIAHSLTGTSHAASGEKDPEEGWWEFLIGPGKPFDTSKYFVVCSNVLGGCSGSTGPSSINPETGQPYGIDFPAVAIRDMVNSQKKLTDFLGIRRLLTVTGGSMGGMQALEWAATYPGMVESIIPIAVPGRAYPQSIAFRKAQRKAITNDPDWRNGNYYNDTYPEKGIELARLIGFITYRTEKEFAGKFGRKTENEKFSNLEGRFEVEKYLEYQGKKLSRWFDPNTYLYLSKAMDLHDMGFGYNSYEVGVRQITAKVMMIGLRTDMLFPVHQQKEVVKILKTSNNDVFYKEVETVYGHDAFLLEKEQISDIIRNFLNEKVHTEEVLV